MIKLDKKKIFIFISIICFTLIIIFFYVNRIKIIGKKDGYSNTRKKLIFKKFGNYIIYGSRRNIQIIIRSNNVTLYFEKVTINSKFQQTILIEENIQNTKIYLNNTILSNSKGLPIFRLKTNSNLVINAINSFFKSDILISGKNKNNLIINGTFKLHNETYISIKEDFNIDGEFNFLCKDKEIDNLLLELYPKY